MSTDTLCVFRPATPKHSVSGHFEISLEVTLTSFVSDFPLPRLPSTCLIRCTACSFLLQLSIVFIRNLFSLRQVWVYRISQTLIWLAMSDFCGSKGAQTALELSALHLVTAQICFGERDSWLLPCSPFAGLIGSVTDVCSKDCSLATKRGEAVHCRGSEEEDRRFKCR